MSRDADSTHAREDFRTTRWSLVSRAGTGAPEARDALESLCSGY